MYYYKFELGQETLPIFDTTIATDSNVYASSIVLNEDWTQITKEEFESHLPKDEAPLEGDIDAETI